MGHPLLNPLVILVKTCGTRLEELIERVSGFGDFEKFIKKHPCKYIQKYKSNEKVPNSNKYKFYVFKCTSCHNCQAQVCDKTRGTEKLF